MEGLFVTGTDTGVGKTALSAALLSAMARAGIAVRAHKPVVTGLDEQDGGSDRQPAAWPADHELLGLAAGMAPEEVSPLRFGPAVSPHLAAQLAGAPIEPALLARRASAAAGAGQTLVVEGVGGLLVPFSDSYCVRDLARELGLGVLIAARPGLGTINHTLLTLEAARASGLAVRAVVLTPWPSAPSALERSNRETIARAGAVEVALLERISEPTLEQLAAAGEALPWRDWLAAPSA